MVKNNKSAGGAPALTGAKLLNTTITLGRAGTTVTGTTAGTAVDVTSATQNGLELTGNNITWEAVFVPTYAGFNKTGATWESVKDATDAKEITESASFDEIISILKCGTNSQKNGTLWIKVTDVTDLDNVSYYAVPVTANAGEVGNIKEDENADGKVRVIVVVDPTSVVKPLIVAWKNTDVNMTQGSNDRTWIWEGTKGDISLLYFRLSEDLVTGVTVEAASDSDVSGISWSKYVGGPDDVFQWNTPTNDTTIADLNPGTYVMTIKAAS